MAHCCSMISCCKGCESGLRLLGDALEDDHAAIQGIRQRAREHDLACLDLAGQAEAVMVLHLDFQTYMLLDALYCC